MTYISKINDKDNDIYYDIADVQARAGIEDLKSQFDETTIGGIDEIVNAWLDKHPEAIMTVTGEVLDL